MEEINLEEYQSKKNRLLFPIILQNDIRDCGPVCIQSICLFHKIKVSLNVIRELCSSDSSGTSFMGLINGFNQIGFETLPLEIKDISSLQGKYHPFIAYFADHYVVVYKVLRNKILIMDPEIGKQALSFEAFSYMFQGYVLLAKPTKNIRQDLIIEKSIALEEVKSELKKYNKEFFIILVLAVFSSFVQLVPSFFFKSLFDVVIPLGKVGVFFDLVVSIFFIFLGSTLIDIYKTILLAKSHVIADLELNNNFIHKIFNLSWKSFFKRNLADYLTRLNDIEGLRDFLFSQRILFIIESVQFAILAFILISNSLNFFLVACLSLPFFVLLSFFMNRKIELYNRCLLLENDKKENISIDLLSGFTTIKSLGAESSTKLKFLGGISRTLESKFLTIKSKSILDALTSSNVFMFQLLLILYGGYELIEKSITQGEFLQLIYVAPLFLNSLEGLIQYVNNYFIIKPKIARLDDLYDEADIIQQDCSLVDNTMVKLENIEFSFNKDKVILKDISFSVLKSEKIAIVGSSGSGKTSLAMIMSGIVNPDGGNIKYHTSLQTKLKKCLYLKSEPDIFMGSVAANICLDSPYINNEKIIEAAKLAHAHEFIEAMASGYESMLQFGGKGLSAGEKQRIALARILYMKPEMIILDESTSALDLFNEDLILETLNNIDEITIVHITHRPQVILNCKRVIVLDKGEVRFDGTLNKAINESEYMKSFAKLKELLI